MPEDLQIEKALIVLDRDKVRVKNLVIYLVFEQ